MAIITTSINSDEKTWQDKFYSNLFGENYPDITIDRSTDGYTKGILFEHKQNIQSYGESKALSQALIYLTRFNRDGIPIPAQICLVGQDEQKCYIYNTANYIHIINDIPKYANLKASDGIPGFSAGARSELISFNMEHSFGMKDIIQFVQQAPQTVKVDINVHNVYGWSNYYYTHALEYKQKPEKKKFFEELRNPKATLEHLTNPWTGNETDFKYIMDMLNDPKTQKELGAFYTPPAYAKKATELVLKAIERVPPGNDYVIIDRCAGSGNLEMYFDDDILSHVIISTYELKEWMVLKDRYSGRVRYIIPPVPINPDNLPELNEKGFLRGANALTREIMDNPVVKEHLNNPNCTIILFENPPYAETTSVDNRKLVGRDVKAMWKDYWVVREMKKVISGVATNDIANAFIWSGFEYFLRQPTDSFILFSPIKYWKIQKLINKKFLEGFAFNRIHFHAKSPACISCILWSNQIDTSTQSFNLESFDIDNSNENKLIYQGNILVKKCYSQFSEKYYDNRTDISDTFDGIVCSFDGKEVILNENRIRVGRNYNSNIIGYLVAKSALLERTALNDMLLVAGRYDANGFYLRRDNFVEKLPIFAAGKYCEMNKDWKVVGMVMKSGDGAERYHLDIASGKLNTFLCKTLIWTCLTHYAHMRSLHGSDGRFYRNELCFDNLSGKTTLARQKLNEFTKNGYILSDEEKTLFDKWDTILTKASTTEEYNPAFTYGLYQIDQEINIRIQQGVKRDGKPNMVIKYGDLNNLIKDIKTILKDYYLNNLVDTLFEYEFLK